ncbi:MAG TPA: hypothetical protein VMV05_12300 [bacterium]|nr:hypothetical protein [bacterium]
MGLGTSGMYDPQKSADAWVPLVTAPPYPFITAHGTVSHELQDFRVEAGWGIDAHNGLAFEFAYLQGPEYKIDAQSYSSLGWTTQERGTPQLFSFELAYCRFWPDGDGRFYLKAAAGYYQVYLAYTYDFEFPGGGGPGEGGLTGNVFGGSLEVGREWYLGPNWGIGLFFKERVVPVSRISQSGTYMGFTGSLGLAVDPNGILVTDDANQIGKDGTRWAVLDYSGFDAGLSFNFYLF